MGYQQRREAEAPRRGADLWFTPRFIHEEEEVWFKNTWGHYDCMHALVMQRLGETLELASCRLRFSEYIQTHMFALRAMDALEARGVVVPCHPSLYNVSLRPNSDNEAVPCDFGEAAFWPGSKESAGPFRNS